MAKINLKELSKKKSLWAEGHRSCAGCAPALVMKQVLLAVEDPVVCSCATGCMEVCSSIYPYTSWRCNFIHSAFENSAATICGVEAAYRSLKKQGKLDDDIKFIAFGGDGGTYDIGFQSLSGAMERKQNITYVCYDNEAYMNTGVQRSSATPIGARTNTTPTGKVKAGKEQTRKDLAACMVAHDVPYVATVSPHNPRDLMAKVQKALAVEGPAFILAMAPCPVGWEYKPEDSVKLARLAVETCFWPLYEVVDRQYKINYKPKEKLPVMEWCQLQRRFAHLAQPAFAPLAEKLQAQVDHKWDELLHLEASTNPDG